MNITKYRFLFLAAVIFLSASEMSLVGSSSPNYQKLQIPFLIKNRNEDRKIVHNELYNCYNALKAEKNSDNPSVAEIQYLEKKLNDLRERSSQLEESQLRSNPNLFKSVDNEHALQEEKKSDNPTEAKCPENELKDLKIEFADIQNIGKILDKLFE